MKLFYFNIVYDIVAKGEMCRSVFKSRHLQKKSAANDNENQPLFDYSSLQVSRVNVSLQPAYFCMYVLHNALMIMRE